MTKIKTNRVWLKSGTTRQVPKEITVVCGWCGQKLAGKPGPGQPGVPDGICLECRQKHFPEAVTRTDRGQSMKGEEHPEHLGKSLKQRRVAMLLTLRELTAKSGVSPSHLARIERGQRFPSAHILAKIARPLGFTEEELLILAGYLYPRSAIEADSQPGSSLRNGVDPYVALVLAQEPVVVQRTVVSILSVLKGIGKSVAQEIPRGDTGRLVDANLPSVKRR